MPRLQTLTEVIHADWWEEGETVTIRLIPYVEQERLATAGMRPDRLLPTDESEAQSVMDKLTIGDMDIGRMRLARLKAGIESWTFADEKGKAYPVDDTHLNLLDGPDGTFIMGEIDRLNPEPDDSFQE